MAKKVCLLVEEHKGQWSIEGGCFRGNERIYYEPALVDQVYSFMDFEVEIRSESMAALHMTRQVQVE